MNRLAQALDLWGLSGAQAELAAARENKVYKVTYNAKQYALRLHRPGYRSASELRSELCWMAHLSEAGLSVPAPKPRPNGAHLAEIDGVYIDVLHWLQGETLDRCEITPQIFRDLGRTMAQLHILSDAWTPPPDFERVHWDCAGLVGDRPLWDRFWDNPALSEKQRGELITFRHEADRILRSEGDKLDYGLIHADLVAGNVMVHTDQLHLIDFDDGGYGFRLFEIATALLKHQTRPDYPALQDAMLSGYLSTRTIDLTHLNLFLALRAVSYVGWNITRRQEPGGYERNARFIEKAMQQVREIAF